MAEQSDFSQFVLILKEARYHPESYLLKLTSRFEVTSVVYPTFKEELRRYQKTPMFDSRYLVVFEDLAVFEGNLGLLNFPTMFVVMHVETISQMDECKFLCEEKNVPYRIYSSEFTREMAMSFIRENCPEQVSDAFCKAVITRVGLSPMRILTALSVCEQVGYTKNVLEKYVDKWVYLDLRKLIECLLGLNESSTATRNAVLYLQVNRYWYKSVAENIVDELNSLIEMFKDKIEGTLRSDNMFDYCDKKHITRSRVLYAMKLFDKVSVASLMALREFVKTKSLAELVLRL